MKKKCTKPDESGGRGVLEDAHHLRADAQLLSRAIKQRWPVPPEKRGTIIEKLVKVVEQESTTVIDSEGNPIEITNARNQAACARVLVAMDALNQSDDQLEDKNKRLDEGKTTENVGFTPAPVNQLALPKHIADKMSE